MIYLDNSSTTPLLPEVRAAMEPYLDGAFGNASSVHSAGLAARAALEEARETIARHIHAEPREIIFTSGGTESNNTALVGTAFRRYLSGTPFAEQRLLTSLAEHRAVLDTARFLERLGVRTECIRPAMHGEVTPEALRTLVTEGVTSVSLMMVNNETGAMSDTAELVRTVRERSPAAVFHTDAVQALGKVAIDVRTLGVDMMTLSAHKIHGPKGVGALYVRSGREFEPLLHGGSQERNRRGGTEAVALAVGFAEAVKHIVVEDPTIRALREQLVRGLQEMPQVRFNSAVDGTCVPGILNLTFTEDVLSRLDPEALLIRFDLADIAVSNGAACSSGAMQPSHVLVACGASEAVARCSVRVSLSRFNTAREIGQFIEVLRGIIATA